MALPEANVVYRVGQTERPAFAQSAELFAEQGEQIPFQTGAVVATWPPSSTFSSASSSSSDSSAHLGSYLPEKYDLEWIQGDSVEAGWLIADINMTPVDPEISDPLCPEWIQTEWFAQLRNPYLYTTMVSDYWVPAHGVQYKWWRGHSQVAEFEVTAETMMVPNSDPVRWGTFVTITLDEESSGLIIPSSALRWSVKSREVAAPHKVKTQLQGRARVLTTWTF